MKCGNGLTVVVGIALLNMLLLTVAMAAAPDFAHRPGTIAYALFQSDGSHVYLDAVLVDKIQARQEPVYFTIRECSNARDRIVVYTTPASRLRLSEIIDVEGDVATLPNGQRAITNPTVYGYTDREGNLLRYGPLSKGLMEPMPWQWKIDLTVRPNPVPSAVPAFSDEPNTTPSDTPSYYQRIGNALGSGTAQTQRVSAQSYYDGIPDLVGLDPGSLVELQCKRITGVGSETIGSTLYKYLDIAEDSPSTDWIRCYYSAGMPTTDKRINKITGQIRYTNSGATEVICIDDGPGYDPQILEGRLDLATPGSIAYARTLQNGATATLSGKVVSANQTDFPGALYVQETTRTAGMRVLYTGSELPARGKLVDVTGTISLASDGERVINAGSSGVTVGTDPAQAVNPIGMANKIMGGGAFNVFTPGITNPAYSAFGVLNKGILSKTWGRVRSVDATNKFFYIDDLSRLNDGSGSSGVRVSWAWPTAGKPSIMPPAVGWYVSIVGISSSDTSDGGTTYYRVLRPRDQDDVTTHDIGSSSSEVRLPAWAEVARPTDSFSASGTGPSSADSVDLATGAGEHDGGPDIVVNNPNGPRISYSRKYRSTLAEAGIASAGLSHGWVHNYDFSITGTSGVWGDLTLTYPNAAQETLRPVLSGGNPTGSFTPLGAPYVVTGSASATTGQWNSVTLTYSDDSSWTFTATNPSIPTRLLLTRISDVASNYIAIERVSSTDERLQNIKDNTNQAMLSFAYPDANTATVSDVSDAANTRTITYTFDSITHWLVGVSEINGPSTRRWSYTYTSVGGVPYLTWVEVPDPIDGVGMAGHPINYDGSGHVASLEDANGNRRAFTYLGDRTAVEVRDHTGKLVESWTQKIGSGNVNAGVIDANGNSTTILYNSLHKPTSITNKNNQTIQISYDANLSYPDYGRVRTVTEPTSTSSTGRVTTYGYNTDNPLRIASRQAGSKTPTAFDYYPIGHQWQGRVATAYAPTPGTTGNSTPVRSDYTYTAKGNIATITTPAQNDTANAVTTAVYDYTEDPDYSLSGVTESLGRPLRSTIYDGIPSGGIILYRAHYRYDSFGRITDVTDSYVSSPPDIANSHRTSYEYNVAGQVTRVLSPATGANPAQRAYTLYNYLYPGGSLSSVQFYDESGNQLQDSSITPHWGNEGELLEQTGSTQGATFQYDAQYRQIGLTDGRSNTTGYGYNLVGNLTTLSYPSGPGMTFDYDADGNLSHRVDGKSQTTTYQRNSTDGSLSDVLYESTPTVHFAYDGYGRLVTMTDPTGTVIYEYDDNDLLTAVRTTYKAANGSDLPQKVVLYAYYPDGSRKSMTIPASSGTQTFNYYYEYDGSVGPGRVVTVTMPWVGTSIRCYYNRDGQVVRQTQVRVQTDYTYNQKGLLTSLTNWNTLPNPDQIVSKFYSMQYDPLGNLLQATISMPAVGAATHRNGTAYYTYDAKGRLTNERRTITGSGDLYNVSFVPDDADNMTGVRDLSFSYNSSNQINIGGFDDNGNATSYDPTGNRSYDFLYDYEDFLTSVTGGRNGTLTMAYRADGLRAWKETATFGRKYFLYDGDQVICELDGNGNVTWSYGYGPNGLSQGWDNYNYSVYMWDPMGSFVGKAYKAVSDRNSLDTAIFDSFGKMWWDQASSNGEQFPTPGPWEYLGQWGVYTDPETRPALDPTCLALMEQARYYDAISGRSVSRGDEGVNPYAELSNVDQSALFFLGELNAVNPVNWAKGIYGTGKYLVDNKFSGQSFRDVGHSFVEGLKFWGKPNPEDAGSAFMNDVLIATPLLKKIPGPAYIKAVKAARAGEPLAAFHYTMAEYADRIAKGGIETRSGTVYVTPDPALTPSEALSKLALPGGKKPNVAFEVNLDALRKAGFKVSKPRPVEPAYGQPGGGTEVFIRTNRIKPKYLTRK